MKASLLLPRYYKMIGIILFSIGIIGFIMINNYNLELKLFDNKFFKSNSLSSILTKTDNFSMTLVIILTLLGLLFMGFSKLKIEDEMTTMIRLKSLQWAVYICVTLLIIISLFTFSVSFLIYCLINWFLFLGAYCVIFNFQIWRLNLLIQKDAK